jgi:hypothetical protein
VQLVGKLKQLAQFYSQTLHYKSVVKFSKIETVAYPLLQLPHDPSNFKALKKKKLKKIKKKIKKKK